MAGSSMKHEEWATHAVGHQFRHRLQGAKPCVVFVLLRVSRLIGSENSTAPTWNVEAGVSEPMAGVQTSCL